MAEPSTGFYADALVLGLGVAAVVLAAVALGLWPAAREARLATRVADVDTGAPASILVDRLAAAGTPPPVVAGARRALERGQGRDSVPVVTALIGSALAVAALSGTLVFGSSLSNLTATPRLYGQSFQLWFNNLSNPGPGSAASTVAQLERTPAVTAITLGTSGSVNVNGVATDAIAGTPERGAMLVSAISGRDPVAPDEIALGTKTLRLAHAGIGSRVTVSVPQPGGGTASARYTVVGTASFPPDFGAVGLSTGAIFTIDGFVAAQCPRSGANVASCRQGVAQSLGYVVLVGTADSPAGRAAVAQLARANPPTAVLPVIPANLVNFGQAVNFPLILGIVLAVFGAATLMHVLVVGVARRRREVGLLKAIGFVRRQVAATVCWQAVTVAVVGLVVGVPVGVATGQVVWRAFATNVGVIPDPVVAVGAVVVMAAAVLVGAVALAAVPAWVSARTAVGPLLRSE